MSLDWDSEALPVLRAFYAATVRHNLAPAGGLSRPLLDKELGCEPFDDHVGALLRYLEEAGYLTRRRAGKYSLAKKGLQVVAGWPAEPGDTIIAALVSEIDHRLQHAPETEKNQLHELRNSLTGIGREIIAAALTNTTHHATELG